MESTVIITFLTQIGSVAALVISLFYLNHQNVADRQKSDDRWANLVSQTDQQFKKSDDRWADLQSKWVENQREIIAMTRRLNTLEDHRG